MSYGYEPPKQDKGGSWGEVFAITRIAFGLLLPFLGAMIGLLLLIVLTIVLFAQHPALALLYLNNSADVPALTEIGQRALSEVLADR